MDRFIVKHKKQRLDNENGGVKEENVETAVQPHHSQQREEDRQEEEPTEQQAKVARKTRSIQNEHRKFQEKWTDEFFFVQHGTSPLCLICLKIISCFKRANLERHYRTHHARFDETHPPHSQLRNCKITQLKGRLEGQQKMMDRSGTSAEKTTEATFKIAWMLARNKRAFTDAEIVKECFLASAEILYADFPNKESIIEQIKGLQLSQSTITRRIEDIGEDIGKQLTADVAAAPCFSIALDGSTDACDVTRLCVWVRFPQNVSFREELLCLLPLRGQTRGGEDILNTLRDFFAENNIDWSTLASVCTDGSPDMRGGETGLIGLMRKREDIPDFVAFHCIVHQEALVAKLGDGELQDVMQKVVQVLNFIIARGLNHRQFGELLEAHRSEYGDLTLCNEVRWLSGGRVLERFLHLLPQIRDFVANEGRDEPDLHDPRWILKLAFLTDVTTHLNSVNLQLQGKAKAPGNMLRVVTAFQNKITTLFIPDREFVHFPNLRAVTAAQPDTLEHYSYDAHVKVLEQLRQEFEERFQDIMAYKDLFNFIENPYRVSVSSLTPVITALCPDRAGVESEIVELQANETLQGELRSGVAHFWDLVSDTEYPLLKRCVQKATSFFVGTHSCEATSSTMNAVKQELGHGLTDAHLDYLTRIATTSYKFRMSSVMRGCE